MESKLLVDQLDLVRSRKRVRVADFKEEYLAWLKRNRRPATHYKTRYACEQFFDGHGSVYLDQVDYVDVEDFKDRALERGLAPASINVVLRHVKAMMGKAERWRKIERNPLRYCDMMKVEFKLPDFLLRSEVEHLVEFMSDYPPYDLAVCLSALCSMRTGEVGATLWEWFDFEKRTVSLQSREGFQLKNF